MELKWKNDNKLKHPEKFDTEVEDADADFDTVVDLNAIWSTVAEQHRAETPRTKSKVPRLPL